MILESSSYGQRYADVELIGQGGLGKVYKAYDTNLGRDVVIKEINGHETEEADMLLKINNDRIPKIYDLFFTDDKTCIVMEYMEGDSLREYLLKKNVDYKEKRDIICQIAEILSYLHTLENPFIYGDLKPENVIIGNGKVKLVDFGSSKKMYIRYDNLYTTEIFSAPEQYEGEAYFQSDIYAFGKLMIYILTRVSLDKKGDVSFKDLRNLDIDFRDKLIIINCLKWDYSKRYVSAVSLKKALKHEFISVENVLRLVYIILIAYGIILCGLSLILSVVMGDENFITKFNFFRFGSICFLSAVLMDINYNTDFDDRHIYYELDVKLSSDF